MTFPLSIIDIKILPRRLRVLQWHRDFSSTCRKSLLKDITELPSRIYPTYRETKGNDLLPLRWPSPPRNILLVKKDCSPAATDALIEFAKHVHTTYPFISLILEPTTASTLDSHLPFPIYTLPSSPSPTVPSPTLLHQKTDLVATFGGDGTILHASSLFSTTPSVPPILSFAMGTLGFLGEWKFADHKRAFREVYMSGASLGDRGPILGESPPTSTASFDENAEPALSPSRAEKVGWSSIRGKSLGTHRTARVLLRNRLKVSVIPSSPTQNTLSPSPAPPPPITHALNEVIIHRGANPHLTHLSISIASKPLTRAVADGLIISTPTGSTAYSLSSGGSIVHPLVSSLLLTPICPRSLSFRPLVLPAHVPVTLRLSEENRGRGVEVSIDGVRREGGLGVGGEVRVTGEEVREKGGEWVGGVPCLMRGGGHGVEEGDDGWVGGLNGLLKFNYPFGEEA